MSTELTAAQRELVDRLAREALERPTADRAAYIERAADSDPAVRDEVLRLVRGAADDPSGATTWRRGFDEHPAITERFGPFHVLSRIGEGGFGVVYLAERREPFVQRVAIKVIKRGMDSAGVLARFEQERQALAVMDHPNVARVYDAGTTEDGRPYFVMEHVQGEPIDVYCDRHTLSIRERIELLLPICEAIQHAHHKGIIHRDIKPSNILVTLRQDRAIPKVIDFGVAKAISRTLSERTIFTEQGQILGTPEYMSPEQAEMGAVDIDTRTDVYALGVVLYELLTGCLPFDPVELRSKGYNEIQRIIREVDPPRPSTRLAALSRMAESNPHAGAPVRSAAPASGSVQRVAETRRTNAARLVGELRQELDWIAMRAMHKDRTRRYSSPIDIARDLKNYLDGLPLAARPDSPAYRLKKFVRRHRSGATIGVVAVLTLSGGAVVSSLFAVAEAKARQLAEQERDQGRAERRVAERAQLFLDGVERDLRQRRRSPLPQEDLLRIAHDRALEQFAGAPEEQAVIFLGLARMVGARRPGPGEPPPRPGQDQREGRSQEAALPFLRAAGDAVVRVPFEHPRAFRAYANVAHELTRAGELDRAGRVLDGVRLERLDIPAQKAAYHQLRADIAARRGQEGAAVTASDLAFTILEQAGPGLTPDAIAVLRGRSRFLMERKDPRAAEPLERIVQLQRRLVGEGTVELADSLHEMAVALVESGRPADTIPVLTEELRIRERWSAEYPGARDARDLLARVRSDSGARP